MRGGVIALATSERRSGARRCLAIVGLLLMCTLMAGAVSAEDVSVNNWADLKDNLTNSTVTNITLTENIVADSQVNITNGVAIIGGYYTISANTSVSWDTENGTKHLLLITNKTAPVSIENLMLDGHNKAGDLCVYDTGSSNQITLKNLRINGSSQMGLHVNGANVSAQNLTIEKSNWSISVDLDSGSGVTNTSAFTIDSLETLNDLMKISQEKLSQNPTVLVKGVDTSAGYALYDEKSSSTTYAKQRLVWAAADYASKAASSRFNVSVLNKTGEILNLHKSLKEALSNYTPDGATVTQLKEITLTEPIVIATDNITFDGNHKLINASIPVVTKNENYPVVSVTGMNVSLQNLNIVARTTSDGMNVNYLNAVTVSPKENSAGSFNLSNSILDMRETSNLGQTIVVHVTGSTAAYSTVTLTNNTLYGAKSTNNADTVTGQNNGTSFGIAVEGVNISDKLTITKNTIYTGMAGNSGSVGMRTYHLTGAPKNGILIDGNLIDFANATGHYLSGIHMDQVNKQQTLSLNYTITNNTIKNLKAGNETDAENSNKNAGIYLRKVDATTGTTIQLDMYNNIISGTLDDNTKNVTAFYANNVTFGASTIYNNTFNITGADVLKYVRLFECDATQNEIKWNSTGSDKTHAGNWWGTWSSARKAADGYLTLTEKAAGLPVADLAPLVTVGQPVGTLKIEGNLSIENSSGKSEILTAKLSDGTPVEGATWTTTQTGIINLSPASGSSVTYHPLKVGTTTVTVSSGTVTKNITITVYDEVKAPALPVSGVTKDETTGNTTISNTSPVVISDKIATIEDTINNVVMVVIFEGTPTVGSDNITGNVSSANVTYPEKIAALSPDVANGATEIKTSYGLVINLKNVTNQLPTIDPKFNLSIIDAIKAGNEDSKKYTFISMITATENVTEINNNVTSGGVAVTFIIPLDWANLITGNQLGKLKAFHLKSNGTATPLTGTGIANATNNTYTFTVKGDSFSSYVLGAYTYVAPPTQVPTSGSSSGSGNTDGALRVLFVTDGGSSGSIVAGLSSGDKVKQPATPVRNGYTFGGWYTDAACTKPWSFSSSINGDMTLYAKWTSNGSGTVETYPATANPTQTATATQTSSPSGGANPTGTAAATTAQSGGVSPTMTKAPAPVFGILAGLLAAGVLLRRRA